MSGAYATTHRIALLIHSLSGGGAERLMSQLASRWAEAGHYVHLITLADTSTDAYSLDPRVVRRGLGLMRHSRNRWYGGLANLRRIGRLRQAVAECQPTFLLSFCDRMNIIAGLACGGGSTPLWIAEHSDPRRQVLPGSWELARSVAYRRASGCVVLTEPIGRWMQSRFSKLPIVVIPPAIKIPSQVQCQDGGAGLNAWSGLTEGKRLLTLGRHSPEKNLAALLLAWQRVHTRFPTWQLVCAGDGPEHGRLVQLCRELDLVDRIVFTGWVDDPIPLMQACDAMVLPSLYEGFPVSLLEAMSVGLPSISAPAGDSIADLATAGAVDLADSSEPAALASAIERLLGDEARRRKLSQAGQRVSAQFAWAEIGPRWDRLLN